MISISIHKMITIIKRLSALDVCICSVAQSYPTLFNHLDYSQTGSSVHGILQTGVLEWDAISYSRDLPNPGIEPMSLISPGLAGRFFTTSAKRDHKDTGFGKHETI